MWETELFQQRLEKTMFESFDHVWTRTKQLDVTMRETAVAVGVERIAEATELRGLFP
jgi:glutamate dehydrogenase (NAD(P)+)